MKVIKRLLKQYIVSPGYRKAQWLKDNPYYGLPENLGAEFEGSKERIGIIRDPAQNHKYFISAATEMKVSYKTFDLLDDDWYEEISNSGIRKFLVWPFFTDRVVREAYHNRMALLRDIKVLPQRHESWMYESKIRTADWLSSREYNHPKTWVFYEETNCLHFLESAQYPLVFKTDIGAGSSGVRICKSASSAKSLARKCFSRYGYYNERGDVRDKQWGVAIFQEYIKEAKEWRMVRVGDSVMCRLKGRVGDYHSGSGNVAWGKPPEKLLDLFWDITEREGFKSMNIDFFGSPENEYYINELHCMFGEILEKNLNMEDPLMGRYLRKNDSWEFEHGYFYKNACANLRLEYLLTH